MATKRWVRIPVAVPEEADRRTLCGLLTAIGLEVRIIREKDTNRGKPKRFVEFRHTGIDQPIITGEK